ncbi:MAG TPA: alpha/beta fold hydrolase, partial [Bacteroidota bacterium]|nr:alpha/beta fold hydrolase [Bacteroidota bacterium]
MKRFSLVALFCLIPLVLFAADSKTGMIKVNGTELYYETIGEGTPILILHGGPGLNHSYFLPQMAGLAKNHKLIFFDQRATGKSSMKLDTSAVNLKNCLGDIEGLRKAFKLGKMNLMGHSFGGLLAMEYAMKYPKNLRSLTLVCTSAPSSALRMKAFMNMQSKQSPEDSAGQAQIMQSDGFKRRDPETMSKFFHFLFSSDFYDRKMDDSLTLQFDTNYAKS